MQKCSILILHNVVIYTWKKVREHFKSNIKVSSFKSRANIQKKSMCQTVQFRILNSSPNSMILEFHVQLAGDISFLNAYI